MAKKKNQHKQKKGHVKKLPNLPEGSGNNENEASNSVTSRSLKFWSFLQYYHRPESILSVGAVQAKGSYGIMVLPSKNAEVSFEAVMNTETEKVLTDFQTAMRSSDSFDEWSKTHGPNDVTEAIRQSANNAIGVAFQEDGNTGTWYFCDENLKKIEEGHRNLDELLKKEWTVRAPEFTPVPRFNGLKKLSNKDYKNLRPMGSFGTAQLYFVQFANDDAGGSATKMVEFGFMKKVGLKAPAVDHIKLVNEALIQSFVVGPHIIKIIGSYYVNGTSIFIEQCTTSLPCFLRANVGKLGQAVKLRWSIEAAEALVHVQRLYLHRNVRSTSFFLTNDLKLKLGNFEHAETNIDESDYQYDQKLTRFLPPETLFYKRYNINSETWSYGVLVWQIYSEGREPYTGLSDMQKCSLDIIGMIEACWIYCECCGKRPPISIILSEMKEAYTRWVLPEEEV